MMSVYGWLLFAPAAIFLIAFTYYPTMATLAKSFFSQGTALRPAESGLRISITCRRRCVLAGGLEQSHLCCGHHPGIDRAGHSHGPLGEWKASLKSLARMAYFTPTILPMIAVANIWLFFYTPDIGLIDQISRLFGFPSHNWLGDPGTVLGCIIVITIWKEAGFFMIFYLAALQSVSPELEEAAKLEGASRWYFFRRVLFQILMPTTLFVLINAVINSFKLVDHLFILTKGGPDNASSLLLYYIYEVAFSFLDQAYASTLTVVLLLVLALIAVGQFVFLDKRVHYQ